jgi:hypothetical protein
MPLSDENKDLMKIVLDMQQPFETEIKYTTQSVGTFFFVFVLYG